MWKKFALSSLLAVSLLAPSAFAKICGQPAEMVKEQSQVECIIEDLIGKHFPNVAGKNIEIREFKSKEYFFKTSIKLSTITKKPSKRTYMLYVNPAIYVGTLTLEATTAILVHELIHIDDYTKMSRSELAKFLIRMVGKFKYQYERDTDVQTLQFGYATGLKDYRLWLYPHLTERSLKRKVKRYLTPEDIENWENGIPPKLLVIAQPTITSSPEQPAEPSAVPEGL